VNERTRRWLRLDGLNRSWRTILQGLGATVMFAAGDAAIQVVRAALQDALSGQTVDWQGVRTRALIVAVGAALTAINSYIHRTRLDPSAVPSAIPPAPPAGVAGGVPSGTFDTRPTP
jgi:hypothetical protein